METQVTLHAYERAKERLSLSKKSLDRLVEKALKFGVKETETKAKLKKYLEEQFKPYPDSHARIYGEVLFIFCGESCDKLVTLYQLPQELKKYIKL